MRPCPPPAPSLGSLSMPLCCARRGHQSWHRLGLCPIPGEGVRACDKTGCWWRRGKQWGWAKVRLGQDEPLLGRIVQDGTWVEWGWHDPLRQEAWAGLCAGPEGHPPGVWLPGGDGMCVGEVAWDMVGEIRGDPGILETWLQEMVTVGVEEPGAGSSTSVNVSREVASPGPLGAPPAQGGATS